MMRLAEVGSRKLSDILLHRPPIHTFDTEQPSAVVFRAESYRLSTDAAWRGSTRGPLAELPSCRGRCMAVEVLGENGMGRQRQETRKQRRLRLIAEAQDLVEDRARLCDLCRRRMRYFPVRGETIVRNPARQWSWRCYACASSPMRIAAFLAGQGIPVEKELEYCRQIAADLVERFEELKREKATPLLDEAMERLCWQMQAMGEAMSLCEEAIALGNLIVMKRPRGQPAIAALRSPDLPSASSPL